MVTVKDDEGKEVKFDVSEAKIEAQMPLEKVMR